MGFKIKCNTLLKYIEENEVTDVVIPESVTEIGNYAFKDCTSLTNIVIPKDVSKFSRYIFKDCESLKDIKILDSVKKMYYV